MTDLQHRRAFLRAAAAAGVGWAAVDLTQVAEAIAWASRQSAQPAEAAFAALTAKQAGSVAALAARIIPSVDGRPGAREAGAVYFIDRSLATFNAGQKNVYAAGIRDLDRHAARKSGSAADFAALDPAQQDELIRQIEKTAFFQAVRFDTIVGTFGLPALGGNRDHAGWRMLDFEHKPQFQPPFGYYDREINGRR